MKSLSFPSVWLLIAALALGGCSSVPESNRSQLLIMDDSVATASGLKAFQQIKAKTPISHNRSANAMLQRVGARIARVAPVPNAKWEFVLFEDKSPNAFALPGGKVGVNTGILPITRNEAGLATVIGHEVAHVVAKHSAERASHGTLVQLGSIALGAVLASQGVSSNAQSLAKNAYGIGSQVGVMLPYSRTHEAEADHLGLIYMARAGYDPQQAVAFWKRFAAYNAKKGGRPPEFLSTHPLDSTRIRRIEAQLPKAEAEYRRVKARRG